VIILLVTATCLIPQPRMALGLEVLVLNILFAITAPLRALPRFVKLQLPIHRPAIALATALVGAWGGLSLILGKGGGMYVITASALFIVVQCVYNAWSLMVDALPRTCSVWISFHSRSTVSIPTAGYCFSSATVVETLERANTSR
jgi:hypothetical protein